MSAHLTVARVDAVLDAAGADPSTALADMLDKTGDWDWSDDTEHAPSERTAVVESSGAWWAVYRGSADDAARRCTTIDEARAVERAWIDAVQS